MALRFVGGGTARAPLRRVRPAPWAVSTRRTPATVWLLATGSVLGSSTVMGSPSAATAAPPRSLARTLIAVGPVGLVKRRRAWARRGLLASSAVSRRLLLLVGCAQGPKAGSGMLASDGVPSLDGERARLVDGDSYVTTKSSMKDCSTPPRSP